MFDHIDDVIKTSMKAADDCATGKLTLARAKATAKNAHNAVHAIDVTFRAQQDKYKVHNVPWTRKRPPESKTMITVNTVKKPFSKKRASR